MIRISAAVSIPISKASTSCGAVRKDEVLDHRLQLCGLRIKGEPAPGDRAESVMDAVVRGLESGWSKRGGVTGEHDLRFAGRVLSELVRGVDQHRLKSDHRSRAIFDRAVMGDFQLPDHLDGAVGGFGFRGCELGEDGAGSVLGVESVGFPDQAPHPPVGPVHLDHAMSVPADERGQAGM